MALAGDNAGQHRVVPVLGGARAGVAGTGGRSRVIHPALAPLSHKNRELHPQNLVGILCNAGLADPQGSMATPRFPATAQRLQPDGTFGVATQPGSVGLLYRLIVTPISRWDRLKGFRPLMQGFARLKQRLGRLQRTTETRHRRRLEIVRLVLAGPDPRSVQDDPGGPEVLKGSREDFLQLDPAVQKDVVLLTLPMESRCLIRPTSGTFRGVDGKTQISL